MTVPVNLPDTATLSAPPPVLLPYQQRWVSDQSPVKIAEKSRRIGLTWAEAADNVLTAAAEKAAGGQNVYYIGYNHDMAVEYIQAASMWVRAFDYAAGEIEEGIFNDETDAEKNIKTFVIRFPSTGHRIVALTSRPSNLRGRQGTVVIDEAAFHADLDGLIKSAMAFLIWGGRVRIISTHNGEENPFNELLREVRSGQRRGVAYRTTFSEAVTEGLYRRVCLRLGREWSATAEQAWVNEVYQFYGGDAAEELDVIPRSGGGAYFNRVLLESCMQPDIPVLHWAVPNEFVLDPQRLAKTQAWLDDVLNPVLKSLPAQRSVYGQDFGRSGDLSVIWCLQQYAPRWRTVFIVELRNLPFDCQALIRDAVLNGLPLLSAAKFDARGNGQAHAEGALQLKGAALVECVMLSVGWYAQHFPRYRQAYEDGSIIVPLSEDIIADHRRVTLRDNRPSMGDGHDKGRDGGQRHGDSAIAGVLAWAGTLSDAAAPDLSAIQSTHIPRSGAHLEPSAPRVYSSDGWGTVCGERIDYTGFLS